VAERIHRKKEKKRREDAAGPVRRRFRRRDAAQLRQDELSCEHTAGKATAGARSLSESSEPVLRSWALTRIDPRKSNSLFEWSDKESR
jgi:hypothetical protein